VSLIVILIRMYLKMFKKIYPVILYFTDTVFPCLNVKIRREVENVYLKSKWKRQKE